jgi:copper chaperone
MANSVLTVDGMTCGHCVETINLAVGGLPGVNSVAVHLDNKSVTIDFDESTTDLETISSSIIEAGFEVVQN